MKSASFKGLVSASKTSSETARRSSRKRDTRCELALRRELWRRGFRYRVDVAALPGRPDIVFARERAVVFCDGDFWHGRDLEARTKKLARGHNAPYWVAKIEGNVARDQRNTAALERDHWFVIRVWESDIHRDANAVATRIEEIFRALRARHRQQR